MALGKRVRRRILFWLQTVALRLANRLNWFASRCYYKAITIEEERT